MKQFFSTMNKTNLKKDYAKKAIQLKSLSLNLQYVYQWSNWVIPEAYRPGFPQFVVAFMLL